ncbi:MAG: hypothetical protein KDC85_09400 [Saprospiraceae bacterium]|nr:hypothetical protein [Saprospiraceae bacterium]MCB9325461.1 hypothetical protein [Lewinellaceae bacterium]
MENSKLITHLSALTTNEMRRFGEFVDSPFFNKHEDTKKLFEILRENKDRWARITKQEVYALIFSDKYQEFKINNLMFNLMELLKEFLGQLEYSQSNGKSDFVLKGTLNRWMWKLFEDNSKKERDELESIRIKDQDYFERVFQLERFIDQSIIMRGRKHTPVYFEKMEEALEIGFILNKLKNGCDMLNRMMIFNYKYDLGILNLLLPYIKERWSFFGEIPTINIYYRVLYTFLEPDQHNRFFELVEFIEKNRSQINTEDLTLIYRYAINNGIQLLNVDEKNFSRGTFRLYQAMIKDGLHLENNEIRDMDFKNIVTLACRLKEFDWTKWFMDAHRGNLNVEFRKNTYNFCMAFYYYNQQNYQEALVLLSKLNYKNAFYLINAKSMQIKIFYELKEYDLLLSFLESYRLFLIRNKKISPSRININQNFVKYTRKFIQLLNSKEAYSKKNFHEHLLKLKVELLETKAPMLNKDWLLENLEEVIQRKSLP